MRTTIELSDAQRSDLLALAGRRGLRGYSLLIQEALAQYLRAPLPARPQARRRRRQRRKKADLVAFLSDGFSTGRKDGSIRHDDYVYRKG